MARDMSPVLKKCRSLGIEPQYLGLDKKSNRSFSRAGKKVSEYRGFGQEIVEELAKEASVPVWNGLTNEFHPTQVFKVFGVCKVQWVLKVQWVFKVFKELKVSKVPRVFKE